MGKCGRGGLRLCHLAERSMEGMKLVMKVSQSPCFAGLVHRLLDTGFHHGYQSQTGLDPGRPFGLIENLPGPWVKQAATAVYPYQDCYQKQGSALFIRSTPISPFGLENRFDQLLNAPLHVGIIGNRLGHRRIAGSLWDDALLHQRPCIDEKPGADALLEPVIAEIPNLAP